MLWSKIPLRVIDSARGHTGSTKATCPLRLSGLQYSNSLSYLRAGLEGGGLEKRGSRDCLARQLCIGQGKYIAHVTSGLENRRHPDTKFFLF